MPGVRRDRLRPTPPARPKAAAAPRVSAIKGSAAVRRWMKGMTLRDEVAQLVFIAFHGAAPNSRSREYRKFVRLIRDTKVGGLILTNGPTAAPSRKPSPTRWRPF